MFCPAVRRLGARAVRKLGAPAVRRRLGAPAACCTKVWCSCYETAVFVLIMHEVIFVMTAS